MPEKLLEGTSVCGGVVTGPVRIVTDPRDAVSVQPGEILVVPCSHPEFALGVMQADGLICEEGGIISHICTVALELGIPCVTEVRGATTILRSHSRVTLNAEQGVVYGV
jgi:phosphohistidine swiveling domain-containing protein